MKEVRTSADQLLVVCGAKTTEFDYVTGFKSHFKSRNLSVQVKKQPGSPLQVVQYTAERWGGGGLEFDQVWCVVDVDEFRDLDETLRYAAAENIEVAFSNPCFEIWLLLHHADRTGWVSGYKEVRTLLAKYADVPADKAVDFDRDYGGGRWEHAVRRARRLAQEGTEHQVNPATRMWRLVLEINGDDECE